MENMLIHVVVHIFLVCLLPYLLCDTRSLDKCAQLIFLFVLISQPKHMLLGTQKNCLDETVLLSTQNIICVEGTQKNCLDETVLLNT